MRKIWYNILINGDYITQYCLQKLKPPNKHFFDSHFFLYSILTGCRLLIFLLKPHESSSLKVMRATTEKSLWEKLFGLEGWNKRGPCCIRAGTTKKRGNVGRNKTLRSAVWFLRASTNWENPAYFLYSCIISVFSVRF